MMSDENKNEIREYLLGRVTDTGALESIEEPLFSDGPFCSDVELVEEELVHDYVFGKLNSRDRDDFEKKISDNLELKFKIEMASALKQRSAEEIAQAEPGFLHSIRAFFSQPVYAGGFAVVLILILAVGYFLLIRRDGAQLAELKNIYQKERVIETRVSGFDYAPYVVTRGDDSDGPNKNKLRLIENKLLEAVENSPTAENHHALGVFHLTQRRFDDAIKELRKAVELQDKNAKFHNDLGSAYFESAQHPNNRDKGKSLENLVNANEEFTKATEIDPNLLEALFNRSLALQKLKTLPQQAKDSWKLYLQKDPSSKWADEAGKNLEQLENQPSSKKTDEEILDDFLDAYHRDDKDTAWQIHSRSKGVFNDKPPFEQLSKKYLQALEQNETAAEEALKAMNYIGKLETERSADFFFAEIANYYSKIDAGKAAQILNAKSIMSEARKVRTTQQRDSALELFEKARQLYREAGDIPESYAAEIDAASALADAGKVVESRARLASLIGTAQARKFNALIPRAYYYLAVCDGRQDQISRSVKNFKTAIQEAEKTSNFYEVQHSAQELASMYSSIGAYEKALFYLDRSLDSEEDFYYFESAQTCRNLLTSSELFRNMGALSSSVDFAAESLSLSKEVIKNDLVNDSLRNLTETLAEKNQFEKALVYAEVSNALALAREQRSKSAKLIGDTFLVMGDIKSKMGNCGAALEDYDRSLEYYQAQPELRYNVYDARKGKLLCFQSLGKQAEFDAEFETVRQLSEDYRQNIREDDSRQAFFDSEQYVFDSAISNALAQNDNREAFAFAEQSKARSLLDFIKSGRSIAEVERDFSAVAKPLSIEEIQTQLPADVQVVQYAVLPEKLAIWSITKEKFEYSEKQIDSAVLDIKADKYVKAVRDKATPEELKPAARELADILLPTNLEPGKTICLIPDKSLQQVPFASLPFASGKFLIEEYPLIYSPSASILVLASENAKQKEKVTGEYLLSVGNPGFDTEEYPMLFDLPQAEVEVREIAKSYAGAKEFTGAEATKEKFLSDIAGVDVIHFAGHFIANESDPGNSKLVLSGEALATAELAEKHLPKTKLVVLSACQTGFERNNRSEGAIGIGRAFLATGSPLVLASNWMVDSESTKDLMIAFHRNRKTMGLSSVESLRQAQLDLLKKDPARPPYYWSAFNMIGGVANY